MLPPATSKLWEQSCPGKRLSGSQKASQGHCPQNGPIGSTISVGAQIEDIKRQLDWGPLRPQDVGRRAGVTEQEREIVWEGEKSNLEECQECSRDDKFQSQANSDYNVDRKYAALISIILLSLLISPILIYLPSLNLKSYIDQQKTKVMLVLISFQWTWCKL